VFKALIDKCDVLISQYEEQIHKLPYSLKKKSKAYDLYYTLALFEVLKHLDSQFDQNFNPAVKIALQEVHDWKIRFEKEVDRLEKSERPQSFEYFGNSDPSR